LALFVGCGLGYAAHSGDNGKHPVVVGPRCCNLGYVRDWPRNTEVVAVALGIWPVPRLDQSELNAYFRSLGLRSLFEYY
jgi:hypothetical protein